MTPDLSATRIYTDFQGLADLRLAAGKDKDAALKEVANQFEAIFIQMMLKSMRDASLAEGIFDSEQSDMYMGMFVQQIALDMSANGRFGIAEMLVRQLGGQASLETDPGGKNEVRSSASEGAAFVLNQNDAGKTLPDFDSPTTFVKFMQPLARDAAEKLGLKPEVLIAQSALETGWGKKIIRNADGSSSHNLFGIKADLRWSGKIAEVSTLEFRDGVMKKELADFRSYSSFEESFNDYVEFITSGSRYHSALEHKGDAEKYIRGLQEASYATDPAYADKVIDIMQRDYG